MQKRFQKTIHAIDVSLYTSRPIGILLSALFALPMVACGGLPDGSGSCGPGTTLVDGQCVLSDVDCPEGYVESEGRCTRDLECAAGTVEQEGACVPEGEALICGEGTETQDGECVSTSTISCAPGTVLVNNECVAEITCGAGTVPQAGECVPESSITCAEGTYLVNNTCVSATEGPANAAFYEEQFALTFCEGLASCCTAEEYGDFEALFNDPGACAAFVSSVLSIGLSDIRSDWDSELKLKQSLGVVDTNAALLDGLYALVEADDACDVTRAGFSKLFGEFAGDAPSYFDSDFLLGVGGQGAPCGREFLGEGGFALGPSVRIPDGCADGLTCSPNGANANSSWIAAPNGECTAIALEGESCFTNVGGQCESGAFCKAATDTGDVFPEGTCVAYAALGESCDDANEPTSQRCDPSLWCQEVTSAVFECAELPGDTESCTPDERCADGNQCEASICEALGDVGDECSRNRDCLGDLVCVGDGTAAPDLCQAAAAVGEPCAGTDVISSLDPKEHCQSGAYCDTAIDTCVAYVVADASCTTDGDLCEDGLSCVAASYVPLVAETGTEEGVLACRSLEDVSISVCDIGTWMIDSSISESGGEF